MNDDRTSGGQKAEADIQTCPHCQAVIKLQEWKRVEDGKMNGGFCMKCNEPMCGPCNHTMQTEGCHPLPRARLDREFDATVKLKQYMKLAGLDEPPPIFTGLIRP
jgi:hypothetical protein